MAEQFEEATLLAEARAVDGLDDFGDEAFRVPLRVLLASLREAPLNRMGASLLRRSIVRSLANRLRIEYWFGERPEIADEVIAAPLVVIGMMRSGTTLLQRVLAADARHYCTLGWEAIEPAPRLGASWSEPDPRIAAAEARDEQARTFAPALYAIHPTHAHEAEEEIMFLADAFLSHVPESHCDVPSYRAWLDTQDFTPAYRHLRRTLQLLQWQKKQRGQNRERWILKTPAHLGYLETLFATFPKAHVVHMHRDPVDTIPSGASLNTTLWRMHADAVDPARVGRQWIERMAWTNRRALEFRDRADNAALRFTDIRYADATADTIAAVTHVYRGAGIDFSQEARAAMEAWLLQSSRNRTETPTHRYTAEEFGLSREEIRDSFADYSARFLATP